MVEYSIMKNWKLFISLLIFTGILFISCASTPSEETSKNASSVQEQIEPSEPELPEPTAEELFLNGLNDIKISFTKIPAKTKKGKSFSNAYELAVTDGNEAPVADFQLTLKIPMIKENTQLVFSEINVITGTDGTVAFMPETPSFAAKTQIYAYPSIPQELNIDDSLLEPYTATADFIVESDIVTKGAILFVCEYNENGKSPKNSSDILTELRKKGGSMIGNAPYSDTEYINASREKIYRENYEYVGTDFGYLIVGTIKFANPVEKNEDGTYTAHLIASMYGMEMKTGNVIYEDVIEYTGSGLNWNKAVDDCKKNLTALMVDSIMYGL